jgi:di/tricarboxylate transporter
MSQSSATLAPPRPLAGPSFHWWRAAIPVAITLVLAALPPPGGVAQHAWLYFAIFAGVIAALVTEPLPNPAVAWWAWH